MRSAIGLSLICAVVVACGGDKQKKKKPDEGTETPGASDPAADPGKAGPKPDRVASDPGAANLPLKPMGAEKLTQFNYVWAKGKKAYKPVDKAIKKGDWQAVKAACEATIAKDAWHLSAHYNLARALGSLGQTDGIAEHLEIAVAGDWQRFGPIATEEPSLAAFFKTEPGTAFRALNQAYQAAFVKRAKAGIVLVGRRSSYKRPTRPGKSWSTTRGELFSYDEESQRYLRLTHTRESVAGWVKAPSGDEIAYVSYREVIMPEPAGPEVAGSAEGEGEGETVSAPLLSRVTIGLLDAETLLPMGEPAKLKGGQTRVNIQYRTGDELLVTAFDGTTEWGYHSEASEPTSSYVLDKEGGKLTPAETSPSDEPLLSVTLDKAWVSGNKVPQGVSFGGSSLRIEASETEVALPDGEEIQTVTWSPDKAHLTVSTIKDACADKPEGSLYRVEAASGTLKHVLRGNSLFGVRWLDNTRFVYEDDGANLRIYDVAERKQVAKLTRRMGLVGIGAIDGLICAEAEE